MYANKNMNAIVPINDKLMKLALCECTDRQRIRIGLGTLETLISGTMEKVNRV
jgi:hypothetical protein